MIVYLDIAAAMNFLLNGCLLWTVGLVFRQKIIWYRVVLGAALGAAYQVICLVFDLQYISLSVLAAFLQVSVAYKKQRAAATIGYIGAACAVAGIMFLFPQTGFVMAVAFALGCLAVVYLARFFESKLKINKLKKKVEIGAGGRCVFLEGYVDSGNKLQIAVINSKTAEYLIGREAVLCMKEMRTGFDYTCVPCRTVSGDGLIPVFQPDFVKIDGALCDLKVGVAFEAFSDDVLLPREFIFKEYCNV